MNKCVYLHELNGNVVYVGSGSCRRLNDKTNRSCEHLEAWDKLNKVIYKSNLTVSEALELEQDLILKYWNTGLLFNKKIKVDKRVVLDFYLLDSLLKYNSSTDSKLEWKNKNRKAGFLSKDGYYRVSIKRRQYLLVHRVVYCLFHRIRLSENMVIDHIDGNRSNNLITNLREISQSGNIRNRKHRPSNTGEQCIYENLKKKHFQVQYSTKEGRKVTAFSYNQGKNKHPRGMHYPSREIAFQAALVFRNQLVEQGFIILT